MTTATRIPVQRDGVLQQGRTPHELYESPNNLFVAGFIGTPHGLLRCQAGGDRAGDPYRGDGFKVRVLEDRAKKLGEYLGKEVIFGIRPEDVHDPEFAPPNIAARQVKAKLDVTELMGNEVFLYLVTCNKTFIDRVDPRTKARVGQEIEAVFNTGNFHLFDRQTETAIR